MFAKGGHPREGLHTACGPLPLHPRRATERGTQNQNLMIRYRLVKLPKVGGQERGWYARAVVNQVVETRKLAQLIQRNCTVKLSDVMAVLYELSEVMADQLADGNRVKLTGIGSFKVGLRGKAVEQPADFTADKIKGYRIAFTPEAAEGSTQRDRRRVFTYGLKAEEQQEYTAPE